MSLVTTAAPVDYSENINNNEKKNNERKNQTYKNKSNQKKIDKNMLQEMYKSDSDSDSENMGDFIPVSKPVQNINMPKPINHTSPIQFNDSPVDNNNYNKLESSETNDMYKQYTDNYNNYISPRPVSSVDANNELLKKLDNILYLLEEQRQEQNNLITEELILYVFLGVFIIYVLDSFVKAGKYVR